MIVRRGNNVTVIALETDQGVRISGPGDLASNSRFPFAFRFMRQLHALHSERHRASPERSLFIMQYDDYAQLEVQSVAFGRIVGGSAFIHLIADPYFLESRGFDELRQKALSGRLPSWSERADTLFWRGSSTHNVQNGFGKWITELRDIPRVQLALKLRDNPHADVLLTGPWHYQPPEETIAFYAQEGVLGGWTPLEQHARYKYQIDIDGVSNAWATFERLLCGSCILKVATPFEMWYYPYLLPWRHYVPVRADLSDLEDQLEWCLSHPAQAEEMGRAGQELALGLTYDHAMEEAVAALNRCRIFLDSQLS